MKKILSMILALTLMFALAVPALATDGQSLTLEEKEALYAKYEEMVAAANEEYGLEISVLPFDEIESFYSEEEYALILANYCEFESKPWVRVYNENPVVFAARGLLYVPYTTTRTHGNVTVTITFGGSFDVRSRSDGTYYIYSQSFTSQASSNSGSLHYVNVGSPGITGYIDGGRTMVVTQNYKIYVDNAFDSNTSVNAYYYFNDNTGYISAQ